jgi:hypothetical protein
MRKILLSLISPNPHEIARKLVTQDGYLSNYYFDVTDSNLNYINVYDNSGYIELNIYTDSVGTSPFSLLRDTFMTEFSGNVPIVLVIKEDDGTFYIVTDSDTIEISDLEYARAVYQAWLYESNWRADSRARRCYEESEDVKKAIDILEDLESYLVSVSEIKSIVDVNNAIYDILK